MGLLQSAAKQVRGKADIIADLRARLSGVVSSPRLPPASGVLDYKKMRLDRFNANKIPSGTIDYSTFKPQSNLPSVPGVVPVKKASLMLPFLLGGMTAGGAIYGVNKLVDKIKLDRAKKLLEGQQQQAPTPMMQEQPSNMGFYQYPYGY